MRLINQAFCAGGCGKVVRIRSPKGSICRPCQTKRAQLWCTWCRKPFRARNRNITAQFCCPEHWYAYRNWDLDTSLESSYDYRLEVLNQEVTVPAAHQSLPSGSVTVC